MYRPLSTNEHIVVSQTIYKERGLTGGLAESMFMAYKARAMALDAAEFEIFQESEAERKASKREQPCKTNAYTGELGPMEFLNQLNELSSEDKPGKEPLNTYEWFYGDETLLDSRYKRLRVKFFNSERYRRQVLRRYLEDGTLSPEQLSDTNLIGNIIGEYHRKYPDTRQGIISYYEILFGDPTGFSYQLAKEREAFHNDPTARAKILKQLNLKEDLSDGAVRERLKQSALESGALTLQQINTWENSNEL